MRKLTGSINIQTTTTTTTNPDDTSSSCCYHNNSPMAFPVLLVLLVIFFALSFAAVARRFFSGGLPSGEPDDQRRPRRPPRPPTQNWRVGFNSPAARTFGLDPAVVRMLPVIPYSSARIGGAREGCVVCLSEFEAKEKVKLIPRCGHVFHPACIDGWLVLHGSCPICRCSDVSVDSSIDLEEREEDEEWKVVVGLGRSRSLCCRGEDCEEGRRFPLRRSCSV